MQKSPVGWHRYQHLVRKGGIGINLQQVNDARGGTRYRVDDLLPNAPAVLSGVQLVASLPPSMRSE